LVRVHAKQSRGYRADQSAVRWTGRGWHRIKNFPPHFRTCETADLFLVLIIRLLKSGGRAAVVLPDGTLFGEGVKRKRPQSGEAAM
jgi:type I restriction-modification system DNA methylase subunit